MAFNKIKTDPDLGKKVHEHLVSVGVETPVINNGLSSTEKIDKIQDNFSQILDALGLDLSDYRCLYQQPLHQQMSHRLTTNMTRVCHSLHLKRFLPTQQKSC